MSVIERDLQEREDTLAAIREGLADVAAGRVRPADEVMAELRQSLIEAAHAAESR